MESSIVRKLCSGLFDRELAGFDGLIVQEDLDAVVTERQTCGALQVKLVAALSLNDTCFFGWSTTRPSKVQRTEIVALPAPAVWTETYTVSLGAKVVDRLRACCRRSASDRSGRT